MSYYYGHFEEIKPIGNGGFSTVFESISKADNKHYAIKKIPVKSDEKQKTYEEIKFLSSLKSDYIVHYINSWIEDNYYIDITNDQSDQSLLINNKSPFLLHIQMELCSMTLREFIKSLNYTTKNSITLNQYSKSCKIFEQLLICVNYLHENKPEKIIHRDLKPENIMVSEINGIIHLKLADFGLSTYHKFVDQSHTKYIGTLLHRAPEVNSRNYDTKADLYSLGIIMEHLFNFNINDSVIEVSDKIKDKFYYLLDIYLKCMSYFHTQRPTCNYIFENKQYWYYSINDNDNKLDDLKKQVYSINLKDKSVNESAIKSRQSEVEENLLDKLIDLNNRPKFFNLEVPSQLNGLLFFQNGRFKNDFVCDLKNDKDLIGYGGFGEVFKAKHKFDEHTYAVKRQDIMRSDETEKEVEKFLRELKVNAVIKYDYLLQYKSFWFESDKKVAHLYIQMELCAMDLKNVVKLTEKITPNIMHLFVITNIFQEIVIGVQYLHSHNPRIFHRDLKPANILLTYGENGRFIKIADFGFAKFCVTDKHSSNINTAADYTAPEVKSGYYDTPADIFSLGMVLAKITNFLPKYNKSDSDSAVYEAKLTNLMQLKSRMIDHVSKNRPTCEEMLENKSWLLTEVEAKSIAAFKPFLGNTNCMNVYDINKTFFEYYTFEKIKYSVGAKSETKTGFIGKIFGFFSK